MFERTKPDNSAQCPGDQHARTLCCNSYELKSRTGDVSIMEAFILFLQSTPGRMLRVVLG